MAETDTHVLKSKINFWIEMKFWIQFLSFYPHTYRYFKQIAQEGNCRSPEEQLAQCIIL